jgi:hypothetical protein
MRYSAITKLPARIGSLTRGWSALSVIVSLSFGFTLIQVDEYFFANLGWLVATIILACKSIYWIKQGAVGLCFRLLGVGLAICLFALLVTWTSLKRGTKPWSAFSIVLEKSSGYVGARTFPVKVPAYALHPPYTDYVLPVKRLGPTFTRVLGDFAVIAGGQEYKPGTIAVFGESTPSIHAYVNNGKLFVDAQLYSAPNKPSLKLVRNQLMPMPPQWDSNFDASAIEVVDELGKPRFQLIYHDPHTVLLRGVFQFENRVLVVEEHNRRFALGTSDAEMQTGRLFKYPSRLYQGQELEPAPHHR